MSSSISSAARGTEKGARLRRLRDDGGGAGGDGDAAHDLAAAGRLGVRSRRFHGLVAASGCGGAAGAGGAGGALSSGSQSVPGGGGGGLAGVVALDGGGRGAGGSAAVPLLLGRWGSRSRSAASRRWPMSLARSASIPPSYGVASALAPMAWARRWDEEDRRRSRAPQPPPAAALGEGMRWAAGEA
jgi:hypothetical protein|uniref:Uncharacterized protein n=1 Tax=Zea mays TaxID=4577 RepID=C4J685_MAIZE|nr:unknown [Zea mays]